jgi:hypothetical protein
MESFFFGNTDRMLYGVFHAASQEHYRNRSVLLLYPVGHEYMHIHRAYRRLADSLSDLGFDVLRFDYACTGDSFGEFEEASIDQWIDSAVIAYDELQTMSPGAKIDVVALRPGTVIARQLTQHRKIQRLVLWEPSYSDAYYWQQSVDVIKDKGTTRANFIEGDVLHLNGFAYGPSIRNSLQIGGWDNFPETSVAEVRVVSTREVTNFDDFKVIFSTQGKLEVSNVTGPDDWMAADPDGGIILPEPSIVKIRQWLSA